MYFGVDKLFILFMVLQRKVSVCSCFRMDADIVPVQKGNRYEVLYRDDEVQIVCSLSSLL